MIPIAIRIGAGEKLCWVEGVRTCSKLDEGNYCRLFGGKYTGLPATRLPQCLAAESDLKRLVEAAKNAVGECGMNGSLEDLAEALKPFEEEK